MNGPRMVGNWPQVYDMNILANYFNQMQFERQLQQMNWAATQASSAGLVQLHPLFLTHMNGNNMMNSMMSSPASSSASGNRMLALPPVDNVEVMEEMEEDFNQHRRSPQLSRQPTQSNSFAKMKSSLPMMGTINPNIIDTSATSNSIVKSKNVKIAEPPERFVFGQPPQQVQEKRQHLLTSRKHLMDSNQTKEKQDQNYLKQSRTLPSSSFDTEQTDQAYDVMDVFDDSFDEEVEDGRYSATMFASNKQVHRSQETPQPT